MPLGQFGPVQFSVEGTFTEKPRLLMNGEEVAYDTLFISHYPERKYDDGYEEPARTCLEFSVAASVGQLEANVLYRVKANEEGNFTLAKSDKPYPGKDKKGKKAPPFKKKDDKSAKDKKEEEGMVEKKVGEKLGVGKLAKIKNSIQADPESQIGRQQFREELREQFTDE